MSPIYADHTDPFLPSIRVGKYNFSESTSLSQCMFVARNVEEHTGSEETRFILLLRKRRTSIDAIGLSNRIQTEKGKAVEAGDAKAFAVTVERDRLLQDLDHWRRFVLFPDVNIVWRVLTLSALGRPIFSR